MQVVRQGGREKWPGSAVVPVVIASGRRWRRAGERRRTVADAAPAGEGL